MSRRVLITNFGYKNALAVVRALGNEGLTIVTSGSDPLNRVASLSRFSSEWRVYNEPRDNIEKFISDIIGFLREKATNSSCLLA